MVRKGVWCLAPYQCKILWFVNVCGRLPRRPNIWDRHTLDVLCRANLDIFWSQDTSTMKGVLGYTKEILRKSREGGEVGAITRNICLACRGHGWAWAWLSKLWRILCAR